MTETTREDASALHGPEHTRRYLETGGQVGHDWRRGTSVLLLSTTGSRTGEPRTLPLIYGRSGDDYLVVASKGGADQPPAWYVNLRENPEVEVQVMAERFPARARTATAEERPDLWAEMVSHWPDYDRYQERTSREIPVVVLERKG
jgi:deazaflavin-dependent oxidoreductase (nitroreductase family)